MFYIKSLSVTGANVNTSSIDFTPGLNIIHGPSNCGKSYIVECLDYMLGAETSRIDASLGYDTIQILIVTDSGNISMERKLNSANIEVNSSNALIDSGTYKARSKKKGISLVWLKLMGINDPVEIIRSSELKRQQLTVRTFYHTFLIKE